MPADPKDTLVDYLQGARDAMVHKLDGLSEHDVRRPLTPTGTNLLGLVKHLAAVELGYLGETFDRPSGIELPFDEDDEDVNVDLWVRPEETRADLVGLYRRAWEHGARTIAELDLDAVGRVPWWPEDRAEVTLHQVLVHLVAETSRHAGHADIVRESIDGAVGRRPDDPNIVDGYDWPAHVARVEEAAQLAPDPGGPGSHAG